MYATIFFILAIIIVAAVIILSLYQRGRWLSRNRAYTPKPGTFNAERDAEWRRKYDEPED